MGLQNSGAISLDDIQDEFGGSNPININEYYKGGSNVPNTTTNNSIPSSGAISFDDFYGASATTSSSSSGNGNGGCLVYGTLIEMADGAFKPIEDVVVGDEVVSYNIDGIGTEEEWVDWYSDNLSGSLSTSTVVENRLSTYHHYFLINNLIKATWEQPFLISSTNIRFILTRDLKVGELIFSRDGEWIEVISIERIDETIETGALDVEDVDNYFAEGFLTHNIQEDLAEKE